MIAETSSRKTTFLFFFSLNFLFFNKKKKKDPSHIFIYLISFESYIQDDWETCRWHGLTDKGTVQKEGREGEKKRQGGRKETKTGAVQVQMH